MTLPKRQIIPLVSCLAIAALLLTMQAVAFAEPPQPGSTNPDAIAQSEVSAPDETEASPAEATAKSPDQTYGLWVLAPPLIAIILAIAFRQVIPALVIAVLAGAYMMQFTPTPELVAQFGESHSIIRGARIAVEYYLLGALSDQKHIYVILFTLLIGGMVGIVSANGGTRAVVRKVSHWASSPQRGQVMGWLAGLVVFFDDYANSMIVGPTMQPICDKLKISRQKLAYIVDSTAAPVASLALIGTWIGAEIGYIQKGLDDLGDTATQFLGSTSAYQVFLNSIPYRFYAIFALLMVFLIGASGRDFGPMKRAERRAAAEADHQAATLADVMPATGRWWYAGLPVILLVSLTLGILFWTGWIGRDVAVFEEMDALGKAGELLHGADAFTSILYGAIGSIALAFLISVLTKALDMSKVVDAALDGMARMFPAVVILVLAWSLSSLLDKDNLRLAAVAGSMLGSEGLNIQPGYLPVVIFLSAAIVSFSTGSSWGTMGILCPVAVTVSAGLVAGLPAEQALPLFYGSVGSVLAGSVFGDHCSPISDTTVLSATASGCSLESHVWTQLPYALTAAVVAMTCGDLLCSRFEQPWWVALLAGTGVLVIIVYAVGRKRVVEPPPAPVSERRVHPLDQI